MHTKFKHHITYSPSPTEEKASYVGIISKKMEGLSWKHCRHLEHPSCYRPAAGSISLPKTLRFGGYMGLN
jgi:hypothetical protein